MVAGSASSNRVRASLLTLIAALLCLSGGALVLQSSAAGAGVAPGIKPEFVLGPGDTVPIEYSRTLIGSADVKGKPDGCRNSAVTKLTCAAHRLKLNRSSDPTYQLKVVLEWDAQGVEAAGEVPDVDLYLFDTPEGMLDSTEVGGAGLTSPETIKIVPQADEYDIVVQAYLGAITGYKITASYTSNATIKAGEVTPDIVLKPGTQFSKDYQSVIAAGAPAVLWLPEPCRSDPQQDFLCDVYRIKLNRNLAKDATNFVVLTLEWDAVVIPSQAVGIVGLVERPVPDMNMYVYDAPDHSLEGNGGAAISNVPERLGFQALQDEYDLVIQTAGGAATNYRLRAFMTDEIFDKPFELLDPVTGEILKQEPDGSIVEVDKPVTPSEVGLPQLDLAPIGADDDIAGIGLGTTEQFDREEAMRLSRESLRNTAAVTDPPSGLVLLLALLVVPLGLFLVGVWVMRRRHNVLI